MPLVLLCGALSLSACDCEDRVRSWVDGRDDQSQREEQVDAGAKTSSDPVEVEPNDEPDSATRLELTRELRAVRGTTSDPSDVDWFDFRVDTDEPWLLDIDVESSADVVAMVDLGAESDIPIEWDVQGEGDGEKIQTIAVGREGRRVGVRTKSPADYTLRFTRRLSGGALEWEPNDVFGHARPVELPGEMQGFIDRPDDRDIYRVRTLEDALTRFEVVGVPGVSLIVRVFDQPDFSQPLASFDVPPGGRSGIPNFFLPRTPDGEGPKYYVVVTSASGHSAEKSYRLRAIQAPPTEGKVEVEPNDVRPMRLEDATVELSGRLHSADDVDRFAWGMWEDLVEPGADADADADADAGADVGEVEPADIGVGGPDAGSSPRVADAGLLDTGLLDAGLLDTGADASADAGTTGFDPDALWALLPTKEPPRPIAQLEVEPTVDWLLLGVDWKDDGGEVTARSSVAGAPVRLCARELPTDRFRFAVRSGEYAPPTQGAQGGYRVTVTTPAPDNLENEPNDTSAEADRLDTERTGYLGTTDDVDVWGTVVVPPDSDDPYATTRFEALLRARDHDLVVELRDQEGGVIARVDRAAAGQGERVAVDLPGGLYYLHVRTKVAGSCEPYTISLKP